MKIKIQSEFIKKAINAVQSICQKKTISEITQNILLETEQNSLTIKSTDLEIYVEINGIIEEIIKKSGNTKILINGKIIHDIIKEIEEPFVTMEFSDQSCIITNEKSQIELNTITLEQFPQNDIKIENVLTIEDTSIIESIAYCVPLSTTSINKNAISTILFEFERENFKATSTDGHCLCHIEIKKNLPMLENPIQFLLSKKASSDVKKIIESLPAQNKEIFVGKSNNKIIFTNDNYSIAVKTINEKFPDYKKIIKTEYKYEISCNRSHFMKIAKRLSLFTENKFIPAIMDIQTKNDRITFKIENNTIGKIEEELIIKTKTHESLQDQMNIAIFPPYILKAANEINNDNNLIMKINERQKPILFSSDKDAKSMLYVVMPMTGV